MSTLCKFLIFQYLLHSILGNDLNELDGMIATLDVNWRRQIAAKVAGLPLTGEVDIKGTETNTVYSYWKNWLHKLEALKAANGDCLVTSDEDGIREYPSLFTDKYGDKRVQGCELCEGGDGYPYYFTCKNSGWVKVYCSNDTFCTKTGQCQVECQPYQGPLVEFNCSKYTNQNPWPVTENDILLLSVYVLEERKMFDRDIFKVNYVTQVTIFSLAFLPMVMVLFYCFNRKIPFALRIFSLNSVLFNGVCVIVSLLKVVFDKVWLESALEAYRALNVEATCTQAKYVTWHEATDSIPHLLADFETYLKTAFLWSVFSTSLSFFFLRFSSYLACVHPLLYNQIVNNRNALISIFISDILPLPVLFCLQHFVYNQGVTSSLIIEIIFAGIVFTLEILATIIAFIAYLQIHNKYKTLLADKSDVQALGAALLQSICPNIILFVFFIYDFQNWYFPLYKAEVDSKIDKVFGNYNTEDDQFYTFLKKFKLLMEFAKRYVTLIKPFVESVLILVLMPPFRVQLITHLRRLPCFKQPEEVKKLSQASVSAINLKL